MEKKSSSSPTNLTRRDFLKAMAVGATAIGVSGVAAACGAKPTPTQSVSTAESVAPVASAKKTLNLAFWSEPAKAHIEKILEVFHADNPNIEVKITVTPWADYWTKLQTGLVGGSGPDVFWINGPNFYQYVYNNLVKDLTPFIQESKIDLTKYDHSVVNLYTYNGQLFGMPYSLDSTALLYNKELFDNAGLAYPDASWTWETIKENARKLTDSAKGIFGYTADIDNQNGYYPLIHQAGGYIINPDRSKSGFDLPETIEAIQWMYDLMEEGIAPSAQIQLETNAQSLFGSGLAAMHPVFAPRAAVVYQSLGSKLGVVEAPKGKQKASIVHGLSWVINASSQNVAESWELIKALAGEKGQQIMTDSGFSMPALLSVSDHYIKSLPEVDLQVFVDSLKFGVAYPISKNTSQWQTIEKKEIVDALMGKKPVADALKTVASEMNAILAQEKS